MLEYIARGAGFGFTAGTSFGPLHTLLMNVTLAMGWRQGVLIVLSPLITDAPIILLMLFVLDNLPPVAIPIIQLIGGVIVLNIAWRNYQQFRRNEPLDAPRSADEVRDISRQTLIRGVLVNFFNPAPYIFWGTILGPLLLAGLAESVWHGLALIVSFYGTFLGLMLAFLVLYERLRRVDARVTRGLLLLSVVILIVLGLSIVWSGLSSLTSGL